MIVADDRSNGGRSSRRSSTCRRAVVALLAEEATIAMPPMASWYRGADVVAFITDWALCRCDMSAPPDA